MDSKSAAFSRPGWGVRTPARHRISTGSHPVIQKPPPPLPPQVVALAGRCAEMLVLGEANYTSSAGEDLTLVCDLRVSRIRGLYQFLSVLLWTLPFWLADGVIMVCLHCRTPPFTV